MRFKNILLGFSLSCIIVLSACEKIIDVEPEYSKDGSQIFTTLNDYEFALTGAYALFRQVGYYGSGAQSTGAWSTLPDFLADDQVETAEDLGNWVGQTDWIYAADDADISVSWLAAYSVIAQSNITLRNIEQFSATEAKKVNRIKGQALAIRAMAHFDVLRYWAVDYDRNSAALGVPYVTAVDIELKPSRLSVKESYDNILKDLTEAETLLADVDRPVNTGTSALTSRAFIDQLAVRGILARVNLYAKDYVKAEEYATLVITARPLATKAAFPEIWKDASASEVLWSVPFNAGEGSPSSNGHLANSNRNRFRPSTSWTSLFDQTNDIRFNSYVASRATGATAPILPFPAHPRKIVNKFIGRGTFVDNLVSWKVLRTAEMYLIRAEARAMQGGAKAVLALADLNELRSARINNYVPSVATGQALLDEILTERRKELFGEGHRWFDLKRTSRTVNRADCGTASQCTLAPASRAWIWPIPQTEIDANENISAQQSPGY